MCLDKLADFEVELKNGVGTGWQGFERIFGGRLCPMFQGSKCPDGVPINCWQKDACDDQLKTLENEAYKTGFHIWLEEADAISFIGKAEYLLVKQVKFKDIVAKGYQHRGEKVVVARERFVMKKLKGG